MRFEKLLDCLRTNTLTLNQIKNLRSVKKGCLFGRKIFISKTTHGWQFYQLNFIQCLLRKIGFYKSTHFLHIYKSFTAIRDIEKIDVAFSNKIEAIARKKGFFYLRSFEKPSLEKNLTDDISGKSVEVLGEKDILHSSSASQILQFKKKEIKNLNEQTFDDEIPFIPAQANSEDKLKDEKSITNDESLEEKLKFLIPSVAQALQLHLDETKKNKEKIFDIPSIRQSSLFTPRKLSVTERVDTLWKQNFLGFGNVSSLSEADIICFGERHSEHQGLEEIDKFINEHFSDRVILIEGSIRGNSKLAKDICRPLLNKNLTVYGWEPHNVRDIHGDAFDKFYKKRVSLRKFFEFIKERIQSKDSGFSKTEIEGWIKKYCSLAKWFNYFTSKEDVWKKIGYSESKINEDNAEAFFKFITNEECKFIKAVPSQLYYNDLSSEQNERLVNSIPERNKSLIAEISIHRGLGKKVIVIGGVLHFLSSHQSESGWTQEIKESLAKHKFAILTPCNFSNFRQHNCDLQVLK